MLNGKSFWKGFGLSLHYILKFNLKKPLFRYNEILKSFMKFTTQTRPWILCLCTWITHITNQDQALILTLSVDVMYQNSRGLTNHTSTDKSSIQAFIKFQSIRDYFQNLISHLSLVPHHWPDCFFTEIAENLLGLYNIYIYIQHIMFNFGLSQFPINLV